MKTNNEQIEFLTKCVKKAGYNPDNFEFELFEEDELARIATPFLDSHNDYSVFYVRFPKIKGQGFYTFLFEELDDYDDGGKNQIILDARLLVFGSDKAITKMYKLRTFKKQFAKLLKALDLLEQQKEKKNDKTRKKKAFYKG